MSRDTAALPPNTEPGDFRVLVVEDERLYARAIARELERCGIPCDTAATAHEGLRLAAQGRYDAILLDHKLPDDDGLRILPVLLGRQPDAAVVMMTAYETIHNAVQAIRAGAEDYLVKQTSVRPIVERVLELKRQAPLRATGPSESPVSDGPIATSPAMQAVVAALERVAAHPDTTVLFTGETGVGKEVAARLLHRLSVSGGDAPFVTVDCIALPGNLVESVLFGHEKGAFTGADRARPGAFAEAGDGTLLLDEIGDMEPGLQGKLLRVLEARAFQRLGSVREHQVRARVVAATNCDLAALVADGAFRHDLYQRLSVYPVHIAPLRERREDIVPLAEHFLAVVAGRMGVAPERLRPEVAECLRGYDFPGNVRELKNIVERAVILAGQESIELRHLPERVVHPELRTPVSPEGATAPASFVPGVDTLESLERRTIEHALHLTGGTRSEAARLLGISRFQLLRRLEKYDIR